MITPKDGFKRAIERWEGLYQAQPQDAGNWVPTPDGSRRLIGTMRGVTPAVLAAHRGIHPWDVTEEMMRSVTLDEAAEIGVSRFYAGTGLDQLPWGPATEALVDCGWGSGPRQAVLFAQRLCGASADGVIGPRTVEAYAAWVAKVGWEQATREVCRVRKAFYDLIIQRNPVWEMYRRGWYNRAEWMLPNTDWWAHWVADMPPLPVVVTDPGKLPKQTEPPPITPPRNKPSDSGTISNANKGIAAGTVAAGAGAAAPVLTKWLEADLKVAIVFGVVVLLCGAGVLVYLLAIKKRRHADITFGAGD